MPKPPKDPGFSAWYLRRIEQKLDQLLGKVDQVSVDQAQFDQDLQALVAAVQTIGTTVTDLDTAVDAWIASHPGGTADFTAEDQAVLDAINSLKTTTQAATDELAKVTPPA